MSEVPTDLLGLPTGLRDVDWETLVRPRRAVFIGATDREGTQQRMQFTFLRERLEPLGCEVIPVHPTKPEVLGIPACPSVLDVEGEVGLAVVLVRDPMPAVEQCVRKGVAFVLVFSAGFAEMETQVGRAAQDRLTELGRGRTRIIGPNTNLNFFEPWRQDLPGKKLAIVTQSGFQGRPISQGQVYGIPIQSWATTGNEADLEWADYVRYYAGLPDTGAIATYVEGFRSGRTMMLAADAAARHAVPIVAIKVGRSSEGAKMASAHTGHLTGDDAVHEAAFSQTGIIRVDDHDEAIEISGMFCHTPSLTGPDGVALYALSGGTAAHLVDLCGAMEVPVPRLEERTIKLLAEFIPPILRFDNPIDTGGTLTALPAGRATLEAVVDDENTSVIIIPVRGVFPGMIEPLARDVVELHQQGRKPILVIWASPVRDNDGYRLLCEHGVPLFHSLTAGVRGARALLDHRRFTAGYHSPFTALPPAGTGRSAAVRATLHGARALDETEAKQLLRRYDIPVVEERVVTSPGQAREAVRQAGGRGVLKVLSPDIAHKSDLGLVRAGRPEADVPALVDLLMNVQQIALEAGNDIAELDINPVMVRPRGHGVTAVDALVVPRQP